MGAVSSGGDKGAVDVEVNVVPMVDLMTCLVAFLLVTAVWTHFAQINIKPKGLGRESQQLDDTNKVYASILISQNEVWVGQTLGDLRRINKSGEDHDWQGLLEVLNEYKQLPVFADRVDIEIAAEDDVPYQDVISAMDTAIGAKFRDIGFIDPGSLSVRFKE
ncbi:MAG TPA: biopolymer transporter ExbD [Kofleriaceae bacterium]|nr:biopolymer transporter ExbD [Kofleriaceae bacterium]